jgi:hypothetical protein
MEGKSRGFRAYLTSGNLPRITAVLNVLALTPLTPSPFKEKAMERGRSRRASLPL